MQFNRTYKQVLAEEKTQTRRLVKDDEWEVLFLETRNIESVYKGKTKKWAVGQIYAVQPGRGKKSVGKIRLTSIKKQKLQNIAGHEATLEGFDSMRDFVATWNAIHDKSGNGWHMNPTVWVLEFELVKQ